MCVGVRLRLALEESESDLVIRVTDTATIHTAAIIHMATTDPIRTTATILGRHTTGTTGTATIATTVITTIDTKLT
ncbi:MAG: hypothetical protein DME20_12060 [Verrucomicrobia bacterium]|nr:MAG: hypothetical protein DME20_12060 [Verrucomicrobiota bacterium]